MNTLHELLEKKQYSSNMTLGFTRDLLARRKAMREQVQQGTLLPEQ
jgi:hypothetical protein